MSASRARTIIKRDGRTVLYDENKIAQAILKSLASCGQEDMTTAIDLAHEVGEQLAAHSSDSSYRIEDIQDEAERALMRAGYEEVAKNYILYRAQRTRVREANTSLMKVFDEITNADARNSDLKRDNANVDGNTAMGSMLQIGAAAAKSYNNAYLLNPKHAQKYQEGLIHIHDFDFYSLTTTCCQIDIEKLFEHGFSTGHGHLREPQDIQSYAALACIAIQSNQNDQHGGQSIPNFDYGLAKGVIKTYRRLFSENIYKALALLVPQNPLSKQDTKHLCQDIMDTTHTSLSLTPNNTFKNALKENLMQYTNEKTVEQILNFAYTESEKEVDRRTFQAMEALIHNLNSMHSRAGAQTPFSSINYGTDTSPEGRLIIKNVLLATEKGLGKGETPIFPIQIFKLKEGVNYNPEDPNYDLFELACECSAKRLFPNFTNLDAPFNLQYYQAGKPETEVATMGCRTRVMANNFDKNNEIAFGRGNLSFTSINLPRLAIEADGDEKAFFKNLDETLELVAQQLLDRFEIQASKKVHNFPFLMGQGIWLGADKLGPEDEIREVLKHGTLGIGFIGLAETLVALYGKHHAQSLEMQEKGLEIIGHMRQFCDDKAAQTTLNFSLIATPAEGLSGRFVRLDQKKYGKIKGVTDKDYYTNSFHVPVYYPISAYEKIQIEAPYHELTNGGHITYVELDGDTADNLEAFMSIVRCMHDAGIGYGSINHPVDRDPVCGYVGIIKDVCPRCGRRSGEALSAEKLAEIQKLYPNSSAF